MTIQPGFSLSSPLRKKSRSRPGGSVIFPWMPSRWCFSVLALLVLQACSPSPSGGPPSLPPPQPAPVAARPSVTTVAPSASSSSSASASLPTTSASAPKGDCDPSEFAGAPASVRSIVGVWKFFEKNRLTIRSDQAGQLSVGINDDGLWYANEPTWKQGSFRVFAIPPSGGTVEFLLEFKPSEQRKVKGSVTTGTGEPGRPPTWGQEEPETFERLCP